MTFQNFKSYKVWVKDTADLTNLSVRTLENKPNSIMLENIANSDPLIVLEIVLSAYDSRFILGGFFANEGNGSLIIYQD
jgi:hypothetical protein